jgi:hypothetical protein
MPTSRESAFNTRSVHCISEHTLILYVIKEMQTFWKLSFPLSSSHHCMGYINPAAYCRSFRNKATGVLLNLPIVFKLSASCRLLQDSKNMEVAKKYICNSEPIETSTAQSSMRLNKLKYSSLEDRYLRQWQKCTPHDLWYPYERISDLSRNAKTL